MSAQPDWLLGRASTTIPTPALVLDLDAFDRNARAIADALAARGVSWRPHAKAHGSPILTRRQVALGAVGATCATVAEAATLVAGGVSSVMIANQLATPRQAGLVARLQADAEVIVAVDSAIGCDLLADAASAGGVTIPVIIEVEIGMGRAGVTPGPALHALARRIASASSLRLVGIMGYEGHTLDLTPSEDKARAIDEAIGRLIEARDLLVAHDVAVPVVSCGGTGSYERASAIPGVTEVQAGGGCLNDRFYTEACGVTGLEWALTVHATVVSRPQPDRAIVDAGWKAMSISDGAPLPRIDGARVTELFAEHGMLSLEGPARALAVGDRVELIPGYSDSPTVLHGGFVAVRNGVVDSIIPRPVRWPT